MTDLGLIKIEFNKEITLKPNTTLSNNKRILQEAKEVFDMKDFIKFEIEDADDYDNQDKSILDFDLESASTTSFSFKVNFNNPVAISPNV